MSKILDEGNFTEDFIGIKNFLIIEFLYFTGVRVSELLSIRIKDLTKIKTLKLLERAKKKDLFHWPIFLPKEFKCLFNSIMLLDIYLLTKKSKRLYSKKIYQFIKDHLIVFYKN